MPDAVEGDGEEGLAQGEAHQGSAGHRRLRQVPRSSGNTDGGRRARRHTGGRSESSRVVAEGEVPVGAAACAMALHSSPQHICGPSGTIPMALWVLELQLWCLGPRGSGHPEWPCGGRVQAGAWGAISAQGRSGCIYM